MSILEIVVILIIIYVIWRYMFKEPLISEGSDLYYDATIPKENDAKEYYNQLKLTPTKSYTEMIRNNELDEETIESHFRDIVNQTPIFSSGAGYSIVEPDSTSPTFTNFAAFSRPEYVEILPNPRVIPSEDIDQLKKNNRRDILRFLPRTTDSM